MGVSKKSCSVITVVMIMNLCLGAVYAQKLPRIPKTNFSCQGRNTGYYADLETGCQVYHMCDGLGRQFSYSCPNTTLFQQRMLICDHWYMVNCSTSEKDYSANLLIGQRDKPFVADDEDHQRTPRPDILSVPYAQGFNYFGFASQNQIPTGSDSKVDNTIANGKNDINDEQPSFNVPTHWSTEHANKNTYTTASTVAKKSISGFTGRPIIVTGPSSEEGTPSTITNIQVQERTRIPNIEEGRGFVNPPSKLFEPPKFVVNAFNQQRKTVTRSSSTTVRSIASFNNQLLGGSKDVGSSVSQEADDRFIKRFNPNEEPPSTETQTTEETQSPRSFNSGFEIQTSSETAAFVPINNQIPDSSPKTINENRKQPISVSRGKILNQQTNTVQENEGSLNAITSNDFPKPFNDLLPPKLEYSDVASTTMGPPIYYEWKWAAPAFDLEPPSPSKENTDTPIVNESTKDGRPDFALPRSTTQKPEADLLVTPDKKDNNSTLAPYFIPDYVFPLDKEHPGYEEDGAMTSFQVRIPHSADKKSDHPYYGENEQCPECHPSFVVPGTCKPCVMIRR